jgi:hypothetical protein
MGKWGNYLVALVGGLAALALSEFGARFLGHPFEQRSNEMHQCNRLVGWRGTPNLTTPINTEGYTHQLVRNSQGMHDNEHNLEKEAGVFRILVLGDSFIEAVQVDQKHSSHQILEDELNSNAPPDIRFEVISAGIGAWGPAQELIYFRSEGQKYEPDLVLAFWVPANDLLDILPDYRLTYGGINCYAPYFVICDNQFDSNYWFSAPGISPTRQTCSAGKRILASSLNYLYFRSRLYQYIEPLLIKNSHRLEYAHPYAPWLYQKEEDEILNYSYQLTGHLYAQLIDEAGQVGANTAVAIVGPKQAVYGQIDNSWFEQLSPDLRGLNVTLPNQIGAQGNFTQSDFRRVDASQGNTCFRLAALLCSPSASRGGTIVLGHRLSLESGRKSYRRPGCCCLAC